LWLTYWLGREIYGSAAGLFAAVALCASPVFLLQLMAPMTDVPVTTWWLMSIVMALKRRTGWLTASGLAAAVAVMTRPNLLILGLPLLALVLHQTGSVSNRLRRALAWVLPASTGPIAVAILNMRLYGSPLASGYGSLSALYSPDYTWRNITHYFQWMMTTQTPFIFLGIAAVPVLVRSVAPGIRWLTGWSFVFAACVFVSYLWYEPFDDWSYLRFLLPAFPMLLAGSAGALLMLARRYNWSEGFVVALALVLVCSGLWQGRLAFRVAEGEARYVTAAEAARRLPSDAVVISNLHSGSVRYYADRLTLRYEWLGLDAYAPALQFFRERGRPVYAMLDETEIDAFRQRYRDVADLSWLDKPPLATPANRVYLYLVAEGS
jgi:4-amino-4-deoxy-L-arabinose transferase-like glycosyltransferase